MDKLARRMDRIAAVLTADEFMKAADTAELWMGVIPFNWDKYWLPQIQLFEEFEDIDLGLYVGKLERAVDCIKSVDARLAGILKSGGDNVDKADDCRSTVDFGAAIKCARDIRQTVKNMANDVWRILYSGKDGHVMTDTARDFLKMLVKIDDRARYVIGGAGQLVR